MKTYEAYLAFPLGTVTFMLRFRAYDGHAQQVAEHLAAKMECELLAVNEV